MLQCEHCDYTATQSGQLKVHSRKHTGEMFQCEYCDFTTTQSGHLKAHSRKHTGENKTHDETKTKQTKPMCSRSS